MINNIIFLILVQIILSKWLIYLIINFRNQNSVVSFLKKDKLRGLNINQLKLEIHDTNRKDQEITTNFEAVDDKDVKNKGYLDEKLLKINGHSSNLEKNHNEFKLH